MEERASRAAAGSGTTIAGKDGGGGTVPHLYQLQVIDDPERHVNLYAAAELPREVRNVIVALCPKQYGHDRNCYPLLEQRSLHREPLVKENLPHRPGCGANLRFNDEGFIGQCKQPVCEPIRDSQRALDRRRGLNPREECARWS